MFFFTHSTAYLSYAFLCHCSTLPTFALTLPSQAYLCRSESLRAKLLRCFPELSSAMLIRCCPEPCKAIASPQPCRLRYSLPSRGFLRYSMPSRGLVSLHPAAAIPASRRRSSSQLIRATPSHLTATHGYAVASRCLSVLSLCHVDAYIAFALLHVT